MLGELSSFFNALSIAFSNTLGGKSTQLSSWRNTLRASSLITLAIISIALLFNFESITLRVVLIGLVAGVIGGLGLPFIATGLFFDRSARLRQFLTRNGRTISLIGGIFLIIIGLLQVSGLWNSLMIDLRSVISEFAPVI